MEKATENFIERGELIAYENPDIKDEMLSAVEEVRKTGKRSLIKTTCLCRRYPVNKVLGSVKSLIPFMATYKMEAIGKAICIMHVWLITFVTTCNVCR